MRMRPDIERQIAAKLEQLLGTLPGNVANLERGVDPSHPDVKVPYFTFSPMNPSASPISIEVSNEQGAVVTIGHGSYREFWPDGGNLAGSLPLDEEILLICMTVMSSSFSERVCYDSSERIIQARLALLVKGQQVGFGYGNVLWGFLRRKSYRTFQYKPY